MENHDSKETFDLTPAPQLLQLLGDLKFKGWQCIAELIDNSIDAIINSTGLLESQKKILVSIPTTAKIRNNMPVIIEDFAQGMNKEQLENAVRAGFSSKNTKNNIGLFGMGFNVATACLANTVEVWTSTKEMDIEIGVRVDLREMAQSRSFYRPKLQREKRHDKVSGTQIRLYDFKNNADSLLRVKDIVDNLNRAYTERIFSDLGISIKVNQSDIKPYKFCRWSENVTVDSKSGEIPAYFEIDKLLKQEQFCENCFNWLGTTISIGTSLECPHCHSSRNIVTKDIYLQGWVGIQRYPDPNNYGVDISRNGRILKKLDKSFFSWLDERGREDPRMHPEYPRETQANNGRIIGQIEANFIVPKYTKDDFESDDTNWKLSVNYLRGEMPLQTDIGSKEYGYVGTNRSPIGNLFRGYRRIDPGKKCLIFTRFDKDGKAEGDFHRQKAWGEKFHDGEPEYLDERKWIDEITKTELKEYPSTFDPFSKINNTRITSPEQIKVTSPLEEKYPGKMKLRTPGNMIIDIERVIGERPIVLSLFDYYPPSNNNVKLPVIFINDGPLKFKVLLNNAHAIFKDFADGYVDLIYMEVASIYKQLKNSNEEWSITRIFYEIKLKYARETMLNVNDLVSKATQLMKDIQNKLVAGDGIDLSKQVKLDELEIKSIKSKYLELERKNMPPIESLLKNSKFLSYLELNYLFKFIEDFPEIVFDEKIVNLPFKEIDDEEIRHNVLKTYTGYFSDVNWFVSYLAKQGDEAVKKLKQQIIRNRISIEFLHETINK